jgi:hypothetical protein
MTRFTIVAALTLAATSLSYPAETFRLEGVAYRPKVPVVLGESATNPLATLMVYKVLPQQFSREAFSNVLAVAGFTTKTMRLSGDKATMSWKHEEDGKLVRVLDIAPVYGVVDYKDYRAVRGWGESPQGVPARSDLDRLAMDYLLRCGGETNEIAFSQRSMTERKQSRFNKKAGTYGEPVITMRGVMYSRQLDGIRFLGAGGRGGFEIDFGNDARIASLHLDWRNLQPYRRYRTLTRSEILNNVVAGHAVISGEHGDMPTNPSRLTITRIMPYYMSKPSGVPEQFVFPFASLDVVADMGNTNTNVFYLDCPILSEETAGQLK